MNLRLLTLITLLCFTCGYSMANNKAEDYIERYKAIAISEMQRAKIPASIKLAQGLLESGNGTSSLARKANNHFGIKCGPHWTGATYGLKDDDYKNGKLIKSCFRVFAGPYESYIAHSDFLTDERKSKRYGHLFNLHIQDYTSWAYGLKDSGYATDPKYPQKLIDLINKHQLYQYDDQALGTSSPAVAVHTPKATPDKSTADIAQANKNKEKDLKLSDLVDKSDVVLSAPKKLAPGMYRVKPDDTVSDLCQRFRISKDDLYAFNRIPYGSDLKAGAEIKIDGYLHWGKQADYAMVEDFADDEGLLFADEKVETFGQ